MQPLTFNVRLKVQYREGDRVSPEGVAAAIRELVSHFLEVEVTSVEVKQV